MRKRYVFLIEADPTWNADYMRHCIEEEFPGWIVLDAAPVDNTDELQVIDLHPTKPPVDKGVDRN
jgi:hypothetical protein